jgi:hypothetical protein
MQPYLGTLPLPKTSKLAVSHWIEDTNAFSTTLPSYVKCGARPLAR